jgi:hypothetical protein
VSGYWLSFGGYAYDSYRDGTPWTLADCFREARGCAGVIIWHEERIVLRNAGSMFQRSLLTTRDGRARIVAERSS